MSTKQANKQHKYYERNTKPQTTNHRDNGRPYIRGWQNQNHTQQLLVCSGKIASGEYSANTNIPPKIAGWRSSAFCVRGGMDCCRGAQRGAVAAVALLCAAVCCAVLCGAWERAGRTELLGVRRTPRRCQGPADAAHVSAPLRAVLRPLGRAARVRPGLPASRNSPAQRATGASAGARAKAESRGALLCACLWGGRLPPLMR